MLNEKLKTIWAGAILAAACLLLGFISWFMVRDVEMLFFYIALSVFVFLFSLLIPFFHRVTQKIITFLKHQLRVIAGVAFFVVVARLVIPCPISGSWVGRMTGHLCEDHAFLRFSDGKVKYFHGDLEPKDQGIYEKVGWNTYQWKLYPGDKSPSIIRTGWFFSRWDDKNFQQRYWCHRDLQFSENRRMRENPKTNLQLEKSASDGFSNEITR